jgi:peptide-methionine (S)-S-oxide reductase
MSMTQPAKSTLARLLPRLGALALVTSVIGAAALGLIPPSAAEDAKVIPSPVIDEAPGTSPVATETAVFAGGCFWGVQGVFQHVEGVTKAVSGYAGGAADTAQYEMVGSGETGHAESVQVTYDPHKITYGALLQIYFSVAAKVFSNDIVTTIEEGKTFYPAEDYHQDYLTLHPNQPYIVINDLPKVRDLERLYPERWRKEPVLVMAGAATN